jgi:hypothetical protein
MGESDRQPNVSARRRWGWVGTVLLLLIIPVKLIRWSDVASASFLVGIAPSLLGPAGLFFLLRSGGGRLGRTNLPATALITAAIALGLEFAQLLPRPGILARVHYTFDWLDVAASVVSLAAAVLVASLFRPRR